VVTHYYPRPRAAIVRIEAGELAPGDTIHVRGHTTDFYQRVDRLERDHAAVQRAGVGEEIAVHVSQRVREGDVVYRLTSDTGP
jgi:translation elongation factor EF-1alpha